jgi:Flp pilus assembly protein TadD
VRLYYRIALCLLLAGIAPAGEESWSELMRHNEQLSAQGKFAEAEAALHNALKEAKKFAAPDIRVAETQHSLGLVCQELGRLPEAEKWYQQSMARTGPALPKALISLTSMYLENGLHAKASGLLASGFAMACKRSTQPGRNRFG